MGNRSGFRFPLGFGVRRREGELERCRTEILAEREIASHQPGEVPSDGEAESDRVGLTVVLAGGVVGVEDPTSQLRRDAGPIVAHDHGFGTAFAANADVDAVPAVADGVGEEIAQDLSHPGWIADRRAKLPGDAYLPAFIQKTSGQDGPDLIPEIDGLSDHGHGVDLGPGGNEEIIHDVGDFLA